MRILAIDIGTGTQDILLFDTEREPENGLKLVMPSATTRVARRIRETTQAGEDLVLTGVTMGGGPSCWAIEEHLKAGLRVFATPDAARTLDDDLEAVAGRGVQIVSEDEATRLAGARHLRLLDLDYAALTCAFSAFGVDLGSVDVVAVAVFDHGAAPPGVSDRLFRFEYLAQRLETGLGLGAFAFAREAIPPSLTRLRAAASCAPDDRPVLVMDTAPAAVLGALEDPLVGRTQRPILVNVGNMHTLAFHLQGGTVTGLFEHHTHLLDGTGLQLLLEQLAAGTVSNQQVFAGHGHGALVLDPTAAGADLVAVTGPRRALLAGASLRQASPHGRLRPYMAVPHGDVMMAGCWGLVRVAGLVFPWTAEAIAAGLGA
jgi:uncharacterized protein (DUF1786 family)